MNVLYLNTESNVANGFSFLVMSNFVVLFEDANGSKVRRTVKGCPSIDDATIEGSNIAEDNGWEMLQVDEV